MTALGELDLNEAATKAAGNWRDFDCFCWHRASELDDADDWAIIYTHHRDSGLLSQSNASVIDKALEPFVDADDPDVVAEHHHHWACGWIEGYSIRVFPNGEITEAFRTYHDLAQKVAEYPLLDEEDFSRREYEATLENIDLSAWRLKTDFDLPNEWESEVFDWLWQNRDYAVECVGDDGAWPEEEDLEAAFDALGYEQAASGETPAWCSTEIAANGAFTLESTMDDHTRPADLRDVQPGSFSHIIGQAHVKNALQIAVDASFQEQKRLDEILLCGPPGSGKSCLVSVLADELVVPFTEILAQSITNTAELNSVLLSASEGILFLDEIHLLHAVQQHAILQVLDKRRIFISGGKTVQSIPVAPFTLVGATTDPDGLIAPLIDRFRMVLHLDYYSLEELATVVRQRCHAMGWSFQPELLEEIAKRARMTPRIAIKLLRAARRVTVAEGEETIFVDHLRRACDIERIDSLGLDNMQQKYLRLLEGGGLRLNVLVSMLGASTAKVLTKTVEPFLLRSCLIVKSESGVRQLTEKGREHLSKCRLEDD